MTGELYLSLGSNLGDRKKNIESAYDLIEMHVGEIQAKSSFFENAAIGFESETLFINTCVQVETLLSPEETLLNLKKIEQTLGRVYQQDIAGYQSRIIDIDIIFYGKHIQNTEFLTVPHSLFRKRCFVLVPLREIAPDFIDPFTQLTVSQLEKLQNSHF